MKAINYKDSSPLKIFAKCAIPSMISMFFISIVTVVDGIFVGRFIGQDAMAAVNIVMPIFFIMFAVADMVAIGSSVQVSIALGREDNKLANRIFSTCLALLVLIGVIFALIFGFAGESIIRLMGADEKLIALSVDYMMPIVYLLPLIMLFFSIDNYLRVCGKQNISLFMIVFSSCINIFLDWLFIGKFGYGISSAAWATGISFSLGAVIGLATFMLGKQKLQFTLPKIPIKTLGNIFYNGSSEFLSLATSSLIMIAMNAVLLNIGGAVAVASFSAVMYIDSMIKPILFGMADSIQPAVSYNLGAKNAKKITGLVAINFISSAIISAVLFLVMIFCAKDLVGLFANDPDGDMMQIATKGLLIIAPTYLVAWFNIGASSLFTGLNKPLYSLITMGLQAIILPIIFLSTLPAAFGIDGVFMTMLLPQLITFCLVLILFIMLIKKLKKQLNNNEDSYNENDSEFIEIL